MEIKNRIRAGRLASISLLGLFGIAPLWGENAAERLNASADVLQEIMSAPDKGIPEDLLHDAHCIVIVPNEKKVAFLVGGKYGQGYAVCRRDEGSGWGAPAAVRVEGGSFGFQIGASQTDVIMLVMNQSGMENLLQDKFTLGGGAEVAAGPVGRSTSAKTDAEMRAKILTYSRSQGVFAGVSLSGATIRNDLSTNQEMYGQQLNNRQVLMEHMKPPAAAERLIHLLNKYSRREQS